MDWIPATILGGSALLSTIYFNYCSKRRAHDLMLKELFTEFNARYDKLNDTLRTTQKLSRNEISDEDFNKIDDYTNLCAEQYFWKEKGRIDNKIWKAWLEGMRMWYNDHTVFKAEWNKVFEKDNKALRRSYYFEDDTKNFLIPDTPENTSTEHKSKTEKKPK